MPCIDENLGLRSHLLSVEVGHSPVGNVGVIKGRLERLVFDEEGLLRREVLMKSLERFLQTTLARTNGILPGIVRPIRQPQCENVTPDILSQLDRITNMLCRRFTNRRIDITKTPQAVFLILKKVRIDRAQLDAMSPRQGHNIRRRLSFLEIPENMRRHLGTRARHPVNFARVG